MTNNLLRILSQARFEIELELKSLTAPLDELKTKIKAFEDKKREVLFEKNDFEILPEGETKKLLRNLLDEDLDRFKKELVPRFQVISKTTSMKIKIFH